MNGFFKTIIAGYGAKKLGGGCFSTILIFVLIYFALGQCNKEGNSRSYAEPTQNSTVLLNSPLHSTISVKNNN